MISTCIDIWGCTLVTGIGTLKCISNGLTNVPLNLVSERIATEPSIIPKLHHIYFNLQYSINDGHGWGVVGQEGEGRVPKGVFS